MASARLLPLLLLLLLTALCGCEPADAARPLWGNEPAPGALGEGPAHRPHITVYNETTGGGELRAGCVIFPGGG